MFDGCELPKPQRLHQVSERDCGVAVFAALSGISAEGICRDLSGAQLGEVSVSQWIQWLEEKGFSVLREDGCPDNVVPCAHLVGPDNPQNKTDAHWVYRDSDGDIHDPSPVFSAMAANDPRMRSLEFYGEKMLTLSISSPGSGLD